MTILFKQRDFSCEGSISISFTNLKEKLEKHQRGEEKSNNGVEMKS